MENPQYTSSNNAFSIINMDYVSLYPEILNVFNLNSMKFRKRKGRIKKILDLCQ
jgi:DNA polymerase elongation subunit (family B)